MHWNLSKPWERRTGDWIFVRSVQALRVAFVAPPTPVLLERVRMRASARPHRPTRLLRLAERYAAPNVLLAYYEGMLEKLAGLESRIVQVIITDGSVSRTLPNLSSVGHELQILYGSSRN